MLRLNFLASLLIGLLFFSGCLETEEPVLSNEGPDFIASFNFDQGPLDWEGGFSGFAEDARDTLELGFNFDRAPQNFLLSDSLPRLSGDNPHENLFLFVKRKITGLDSNKVYKVDFDIEFLAQNLGYGSDTITSQILGIMKAGAMTEEPVLQVNNGMVETAFDKGNGLEPGEDLQIIGGIPLPFFQVASELTRGTTEGINIEAATNSSGEMWVTVGVESDVYVHQAYYLYRINLFFSEVD